MNRHPAAGGDAAACGDASLAVSLAKKCSEIVSRGAPGPGQRRERLPGGDPGSNCMYIHIYIYTLIHMNMVL